MSEKHQIGTITIGNKAFRSEGIYVGRPSIFGNPYSHTSEEATEDLSGRQVAIEKFRVHLNKKMQEKGSPLAREVLRLARRVRMGEDLKLVCWCAPKPCHAEVIREYIYKELQGR